MSYLTVKELYEKYPNTRFFKIMYKHLDNVNVGLNIKECKYSNGCGLCFSTQYDLYGIDVYQNRSLNRLIQPPTLLYEVFFTDEVSDAKIYEFPKVFMCDKYILGEPIIYNPFICDIENYDFYKKVVSQNGLLLNYIKDKTYELCELAVKQNGLSLNYVTNKTNELCKLAVQENGVALEFVDEPLQTDELCKIAVQQDGLALEFVINQTYEICELAIQQNAYSLYYVNNQFKTIELCKLAVENDEECIGHVPQEFYDIIKKYSDELNRNTDE